MITQATRLQEPQDLTTNDNKKPNNEEGKKPNRPNNDPNRRSGRSAAHKYRPISN
jgi:hypothetical protein